MTALVSQDVLLVAVVMLPGLLCAGLAFSWLVGVTPSERVAAGTGSALHLALLAFALVLWATRGATPVVVHVTRWFAVGDHAFDVVLTADRLSLPMMSLTILLTGIIGHFSSTYLHREHGYFRFFALLYLFTFGALLVFAAGTLDVLVAGWELVGITSVLLVGFFHDRAQPVDGATRVFGVYRATDLGLLVAAVLLHQWGASAALLGNVALTGGQRLVIGGLVVVAASGKSAQVPFSGWLPRAMEGPTPSSAIFYGAIAVHLGAFLLLRLQPVLASSLVVTTVTIMVGLATACVGTLAGRAAADAKTSLAQASLTQVGLVFVEIGCGWTDLAVWHMVGHALLRTLQFLRAPSMLHDHHQMHAATGGHLVPTGAHFERFLPDAWQRWLYRSAIDRGHLDTVLDRVIVEPLTSFSVLLGRIDAWTGSAALNDRHEVSLVHTPVKEGLDG